jgi:hypothetical protein
MAECDRQLDAAACHRSSGAVRWTASIGLGALLATTACSGGNGGGADGVIRSGLDNVPADLYESINDESSSFSVTIGDVTAGAELLELDAPAAGRDEAAVSRWLFELSSSDPELADASGSTLMLPSSDFMRAPPTLVRDELGIDLGAITTYTAVNAPPWDFVALTGEFELDSALDDLGEGVFGYGSGDDFESRPDEVSPLSRIGRPLRLAQNEQGTVVSSSTDAVKAFLAGGETLGDDERFVAVADALDAAGAIGAYIDERDFSFSGVNEDLSELVLDDENATDEEIDAFAIVAIGAVDGDGEANHVVVYHFDDDDEATGAVDVLDQRWKDSQLFATGESISEYVDVVSVTADGTTVTVSLDLLDGRPTMLLVDMLVRRERVFLS